VEDLDNFKNSFGLFGLRERVQTAGGSMSILSATGKGFRLEIILPAVQPVEEAA